ncbi:hypothetical protein MIZ03_1553 [Rhodoferax lithotrophicus]|uniref:Uncharacterized protein n=1 Tax=Rhodoferax lithotrophicus TaxID=2798804 RepID=A0ABN6D3W2_9BURK|nr:hypothetical protein MIZ03_1553 [Rhodoferax sp. MIZ03]
MHKALRLEDNQAMSASSQISKTAGFDAIFIAAKSSMAVCGKTHFQIELVTLICSTLRCKSRSIDG